MDSFHLLSSLKPEISKLIHSNGKNIDLGQYRKNKVLQALLTPAQQLLNVSFGL